MRRVLAVTVAGVAVGMFAGCSVHPGVAAVVEDRTITQKYLEQTRTGLDDVGLHVSSATTLAGLVQAPYFIDAAEENGVGVTAAQARAAVVDELEALGRDPGAPIAAGVVEIRQFTLSFANLQALPDGAEIIADLYAEIAELEVEVNPRYGEMDPETGLIDRPPLPWITTGT